MNGTGLRSGVHRCYGFFKREGEKNPRGMKGKGLRSFIHFAFTGIGNALSFLLISPVFLPDKFFHLANPQPVVVNHDTKTILFINGNITETTTSTALRRYGFHENLH